MGAMPGAVVPSWGDALPALAPRPSSFFVRSEQLLFAVTAPGSASVCSPNSAALPGAARGLFAETAAPTPPRRRAEPGTGASWSLPTPGMKTGLLR